LGEWRHRQAGGKHHQVEKRTGQSKRIFSGVVKGGGIYRRAADGRGQRRAVWAKGLGEGEEAATRISEQSSKNRVKHELFGKVKGIPWGSPDGRLVVLRKMVEATLFRVLLGKDRKSGPRLNGGKGDWPTRTVRERSLEGGSGAAGKWETGKWVYYRKKERTHSFKTTTCGWKGKGQPDSVSKEENEWKQTETPIPEGEKTKVTLNGGPN